MIRIVFEDEHLVVVHKAAGLLVHRSWLDRHETQFAMQMTRDLVGCHVFPIHRLDRPTSGLLVFAKSADVARLMSEQLAQHHWTKHYFALVRGHVQEADTLDYPLKEELDKIADKHADPDKEAQSAVTRYRPWCQGELPHPVGRYPTARYTLLAMQPLTGRKHQLRRHAAHLRHPIVGDTTHGDRHHNKFYREHFGLQRLWLLAKALKFDHPISGQPLWLETEFEPEWFQVFEQMGWSTDQEVYRLGITSN